MSLRTERGLNLVLWCGAVLAIGLFCYGAAANANQINLDIDRVDQAAYLTYARNLYKTAYHYVGGRNRMPIYPFLLSWIYNFDLSDNEFFIRAKYFNIALSAALLPGIFFLLRQKLALLPAISLWLITTFTVFMFRAGYVQVELLFYVLNFCCFLIGWQLLKQPSWWLSILAGLLFGITHLTKASILPALLLLLVCLILRGLFAKQQSGSSRRSAIAHHLLNISLVVLFFLLTVSPYISASQRFFGQYFYNVNSTFYLWYDSWEEAEQGTRIRDDNEGWPQMPADQIPSLSKYLQEHTAAQMLDRLGSGVIEVYSVVNTSYGYWKYVLLYLTAAIALMVTNFRLMGSKLKQYWWIALFLVGYFVGYLTLYAWYAPIAEGNRFILAQFLPFMLTLAVIQQRLAPTQQIARNLKINLFKCLNFVILGIILFELYPIMTDRILTTFAAT